MIHTQIAPGFASLLGAFLLVVPFAARRTGDPQSRPAALPESLQGGRLVSAAVTRPPTIDGKDDDEAWRSATPLELIVKRVVEPDLGRSARLSLRSVHTVSTVYFLVSWEDASEDVSHKTWVWNAEKKAYEEGSDREDMMSLAFELSGPFTGDMLSGEESVWDVWHWKALRTNPQGFAMDKTHRYTREKPPGKANSHPARNGTTIWIARPEDAGDSAEKKRPAPSTHEGDRVAQFVPTTPSGSAADVRARGRWSEGRWIVELERNLVTGHADDSAFDRAGPYKMAASVFDRTGDMDKSSGVIELVLGGR